SYGLAAISVIGAVPLVGDAFAAAAKGAKLAKGAKTAGQLGKEGEAAVRGAHEIGEKAKLTINGRGRIPDGLSKDALSEVKNVEKLSFTRQLRDYSQYATDEKLRFDLYLRPTTKVSGPLQEAFDKGLINRLDIPQ
ncbi:MAG TPA: putative toxin, partial [Pyrinomonadaceae bacterium]|nr:putative toxin [Pyrinomonadaceae bacterium]